MAILIDASGERILRTSDLPSYDSDYSVSFWYGVVGTPGSNSTDALFSINDNTNDDDNVGLRNTSGTVTLRILTNTNGTSTSTLGSNVIGSGGWIHVALVRAGNGDRKAYLNGELEVTHTTSVSGRTAPTRMELGGLRSSNADSANGRFAGVKVWTRALTQAEICLEMETLRPISPDSLHLWSPMFPGSGENVLDYSGNGRDWTLSATPTDADGPPVAWGDDVALVTLPPPDIAVTVTAAPVSASIAEVLYPRDEDYQNQWFEYGGIDITGLKIVYIITVYSLTYSEVGGWPHSWSDPTNPHVSFRFVRYVDVDIREEIGRIDFLEPGSAMMMFVYPDDMPFRTLLIYPTGDIDLDVVYYYLNGTDEPE